MKLSIEVKKLNKINLTGPVSKAIIIPFLTKKSWHFIIKLLFSHIRQPLWMFFRKAHIFSLSTPTLSGFENDDFSYFVRKFAIMIHNDNMIFWQWTLLSVKENFKKYKNERNEFRIEAKDFKLTFVTFFKLLVVKHFSEN